jgi:hypothetical protein
MDIREGGCVVSRSDVLKAAATRDTDTVADGQSRHNSIGKTAALKDD